MRDQWFKWYLYFFAAGRRMGCHQLPERSFFIKGWQFPVCARCTGVLLGQLVMVLLLLIGVRVGWPVGVAFLALMFIDWFLQYIKVLPSTNMRRLCTGLLAGGGLVIIYFHIIQKGLSLLF